MKHSWLTDWHASSSINTVHSPVSQPKTSKNFQYAVVIVINLFPDKALYFIYQDTTGAGQRQSGCVVHPAEPSPLSSLFLVSFSHSTLFMWRLRSAVFFFSYIYKSIRSWSDKKLGGLLQQIMNWGERGKIFFEVSEEALNKLCTS